ncbi:uncharacterized protein TRIADDRAFT_3407, partial [Trichoplax adhaerens]
QHLQTLNYGQVGKLVELLETCVEIHGYGNLPTLQIPLKELLRKVRNNLRKDNVNVRNIRLNGGTASYILNQHHYYKNNSQYQHHHQQQQLRPAIKPHYNDIDLVFNVDMSDDSQAQVILTTVLRTLLEYLPDSIVRNGFQYYMLKKAYLIKLVKVFNGANRWSLISFRNYYGRNVEFKFVDTIERQFQFSVDSFQILLDSILSLYDYKLTLIDSQYMSSNFYPTVIAECLYGDFDLATEHLHKKIIATKKPEEIRGGGLLKYCSLLLQGYKPESELQMGAMARYMCSRFFIDFTRLEQQEERLVSYLDCHFHNDYPIKYKYLLILKSVIKRNTVCLMDLERRQTLRLINKLIY